ncbi:Transcriptional regulator, AraC family [Alloalcanivorax xenomutans]|nr:Transcriptional regulator, AraC family [Alloalcanivorax xenomutans]
MTPLSPLFIWQGGWLMLASSLRNRPHRHVAASLLVGLEGPLRVQIAGHWVGSPLVWVAPDVEQALESPGPVAVLHLDPDDGAWRGLPVQGPGGALPESRLPGFREALAGLREQSGVEAVRALRERLRAAAPPLDPRIAAACQALRREDLDGARLASAAGLSESRFRHLFREQVGVSLKRFQLHLKCQRALRLWRDGMSFAELAGAVGFYDQPHLNRTLRAMFDALPSRYARAFPVQVVHLDCL